MISVGYSSSALHLTKTVSAICLQPLIKIISLFFVIGIMVTRLIFSLYQLENTCIVKLRWISCFHLSIITYFIDSNFQIWRTVFVILAKSERELFDAAVEDYSKYTCVQWKPKTDADKGRFVVVQDRSGCWSYIGMHNFQAWQPLSLAPRCRSVSACVFIKNPFWQGFSSSNIIHTPKDSASGIHIRLACFVCKQMLWFTRQH